MRKLLLFIIFMLPGCEINAPWPKNYHARIATVNDNICMLIPASQDEFMVSLEINGTGKGGHLIKRFEGDKVVQVFADKCVPLYGYNFESGRAYGISVLLETKKTQGKGIAGRAFSSSFSLWRDENNKLQAGSTY